MTVIRCIISLIFSFHTSSPLSHRPRSPPRVRLSMALATGHDEAKPDDLWASVSSDDDADSSAAQAADAEDERNMAISSIAAYITAASFFFCLGGPWTHEDGSSRDLRAWTMRGWCR